MDVYIEARANRLDLQERLDITVEFSNLLEAQEKAEKIMKKAIVKVTLSNIFLAVSSLSLLITVILLGIQTINGSTTETFRLTILMMALETLIIIISWIIQLSIKGKYSESIIVSSINPKNPENIKLYRLESGKYSSTYPICLDIQGNRLNNLSCEMDAKKAKGLVSIDFINYTVTCHPQTYESIKFYGQKKE